MARPVGLFTSALQSIANLHDESYFAASLKENQPGCLVNDSTGRYEGSHYEHISVEFRILFC